MPNYEYRCLYCKRRFEIRISYKEYGSAEVHCPHCQSSDVTRKINRVRIGRSEESHLESLADPERMSHLEDDPRALGRMMRDMSSQVGENMGAEFDEVVNRLESGQSPEQIESDLPDLADSVGGSADDFGE